MPSLVFRRDHLRSTSGIIHLPFNLGIISGLGIICGAVQSSESREQPSPETTRPHLFPRPN